MAGSLGSLNVELAANIAQFKADMGKAAYEAEKAMGRANIAVDGLKKAFAGLGIGISLGKIFTDSVAAAKEAEQASARLDAVLKSTGFSAGITRKELDGIADALAQSTQFDDESLRNASAELLKFGNIQGDVFRETLKLSTDVAAFLGEDVTSAAAKLGKSMVEPETAFGLLKRAGVALTEQQKDQIKVFEESGNKAEAQRVILTALEKAFGGAAEALNTGLTKATSDAGKAWDELMESMGKTSAMKRATEGGLFVVTSALVALKEAIDGVNTDRIDAILLRAGASGLPKLPGVEQGNDLFAGKTMEDVKAANAAAAKKREQEQNAEYSRRKKLAEEAKKSAAEGDKFIQSLRLKIATADAGEFAMLRMEAAQKKVSAGAEPYIKKLEEAKAASQDWEESNKAAIEDAIASNKEWIDTNKKFADAGKEVFESTRTEAEKLSQTYVELDALLQAGAITWDTYGRAVFAAQDKFDEVKDAGKDMTDALKQSIEGWGRDASKTFTDWAFGAKVSIGDVGKAFAKEMFNMLAYESVFKPLANDIKNTDFVSAIGSFFGGGKATGGPVQGGMTYLVGEKGPELLHMGSSGSITPNHALGGAQVNIVVNNNTQGTEARVNQSHDGNGTPTFEIVIDQIEGAMTRRIQRGNGLAPTLEGIYRLNRAAGVMG